MHFVPQQVDEVLSSIFILCLDSLSAFARTHPLTPVRFTLKHHTATYHNERTKGIRKHTWINDIMGILLSMENPAWEIIAGSLVI